MLCFPAVSASVSLSLRALLRNSPILILDEATSALDTESERAIQAALDELQKNRTSLGDCPTVCRRLSRPTRSWWWKMARSLNAASHTDLLEHKGVYAQLHKMQFGA
ncbi:lipid A export ATP-binding/permease MsbA [Klebsiella michiganensis]|uniref:Lipid A export ATP-binding/permease MsbA n=1 Tax=Klebsiella michiganensis TaxID=1134687 RepID=A0A7H4N2L1_9ENTR|nr:lipid A export ATP-binding/permease MsbA [Klebsiella michiganensis]